MGIKYVKGDLVDLINSGEYSVFMHGCNCFNTMNSGVAKIVRENFSGAYEADLCTSKGDRGKLGGYTLVTHVTRDNHFINIVNAYTQYKYGRGIRHFNYEALVSVLYKVKAVYYGEKLLMVKIGSGLGGGDWGLISKIVDHILGDSVEVTVIDY